MYSDFKSFEVNVAVMDLYYILKLHRMYQERWRFKQWNTTDTDIEMGMQIKLWILKMQTIFQVDFCLSFNIFLGFIIRISRIYFEGIAGTVFVRILCNRF